MAWAKSPHSIEYTDDEKFDRQMKVGGYPFTGASPEVPDYPQHCCFTLLQADLDKIGYDGDGDIHDEMRFSAMGTVTATSKDADDCRIEIEISEIAGEDGKFSELTNPACICLCGPELEKIELDNNAERGDMIHLIGRARLESVMDNEYAGKVARLQITELNYEDESAESREG